MKKHLLIQKAYDRSIDMNLANPQYVTEVGMCLFGMLGKDLGAAGDITTRFVVKNSAKTQRRAIIKAKEAGVICGLAEAEWFYNALGLKANALVKDGAKVDVGDIVFEIFGTVDQLLESERTGLNFLQRMSGIATEVNSIVEQIKKINSQTIVAASRKTIWYLDNKAVKVGGGYTHRLGLWESIMIKDNHLEELKLQGIKDPIAEALNRAWQHKEKAVFIEIEVLTKQEALHAAEIFNQLNNCALGDTPCIIMLDHVKPKEISEIIDALKERALYDQVILESSGNINKNNVCEYAKANPDVISMGAITNSIKAFDLSQAIT